MQAPLFLLIFKHTHTQFESSIQLLLLAFKWLKVLHLNGVHTILDDDKIEVDQFGKIKKKYRKKLMVAPGMRSDKTERKQNKIVI